MCLRDRSRDSVHNVGPNILVHDQMSVKSMNRQGFFRFDHSRIGEPSVPQELFNPLQEHFSAKTETKRRNVQ